jgi:hypothetical protein
VVKHGGVLGEIKHHYHHHHHHHHHDSPFSGETWGGVWVRNIRMHDYYHYLVVKHGGVLGGVNVQCSMQRSFCSMKVITYLNAI